MGELGPETESLLRLCRVDAETELPSRLYESTPEGVAEERKRLTLNLLNGVRSKEAPAALRRPVHKSSELGLTHLRRKAAVIANVGLVRHIILGSHSWPVSKVYSQRLLDEASILPAIDVDDLWQEALIELYKSTATWRSGAGANFASHSIGLIKQAIPRAITRGGRTVSVSQGVLQSYRSREAGTITGLPLDERFMGEEPPWPDWNAVVPLVSKPDMDVEDGDETVRIQRLIPDEDLPLVADVPPAIVAEADVTDDLVSRVDREQRRDRGSRLVDMLLRQLDERSRRIVEETFGFTDGEPKTIAYIAKAIGSSETQTRRLKKEAMDKLRKLADTER